MQREADRLRCLWGQHHLRSGQREARLSASTKGPSCLARQIGQRRAAPAPLQQQIVRRRKPCRRWG